MALGSIQGGAFCDAQGNLLANGSLSLQLSSPAQNNTDGQIVPAIPNIIQLNGTGNVPNPTPLWNNDLLLPYPGTFYLANLYNSNGALVRGPEIWIIIGASPVDLGTITIMSFTPTVALPDPLILNGSPTGTQTVAGNVVILGTLIAKGTPYEIENLALTAQSAAIAQTPLVVLGASSSGQVRLSWNAKVTTPATNTSNLGPLVIYYTDADGTSQSIQMACFHVFSGNLASGGAARTGNGTSTGEVGIPIVLNCLPGSAISYSFGYASVGATAMLYELNILAEQL
jgi:hypothetical protein